MKKLITKSIFTFALLGTFLLGGVFAIDVINAGYSNSCNPNQSITRNYYLTDNNYTTNPSDGFTAVGTDALLFSNGTTVGIWRNGIIAQNSCNSWLRSSNAAKQGISNTLAIFNDDGCRFNIPNYTKTNSASIDAQIQYTIAYRNTPGSPSVGQTTNKFYYRTGGSSYRTCYPGGEHKNNRQDCPDATLNVGDLRTHVGECINYRIFRCGDGLVNGYNGSTSYNNGTFTEQCDPNLASSIPNGYTCNASCQLVPNAPTIYCGDGIINQASEDCDPGSGNFGNGCNSNCQLMTPNCTLTANPNQGNIPLTTSINGTTNGWWARITNLNFGDGQNIGNGWDPVSFPQNHTYSTVGTFYLTGTVRNIITPIRTGAIRPVAYCSISVTATNPTPQPYCGDGILQSNEQCDPGSGNFGNGCNSNCQLMTPNCTLTVNPSQGNIPLTTTINGTKPNWATYLNLNFGDGSPLQNNPTFTLTHTYNTVGTFNLTLTVQNNYNGQVNGTKPTATCSASVHTTNPAPQPYCGDGILQSNEQCDPGSGNFGNGCNSNCQLMTPTCTLTVNPNQGTIPLNTTINGTKPNWAKYLNLTFGDGQSQSNPIFTLNHTYNTVGTFNLTLTVQNNYNGQVNGTKPTATCSASVTATQPGSPIPYLLKQQKTGGMANFTSNQINVGIGETITYKVNFGNSGTVAATGEVWDILPPCVNYLTSSIHLPNGVTYNGPEVNQVNAGNQTMVKYKNFKLQPGKGGYMLVQAQVRGTGMNGMTSCQNVYSYLNTGYFKFIGGNTLSSQVIAVRPQAPHLTITKELLTAGDMTAGSTVAYKITLRNDGNATYYNAYILDILPNAIQYQTSSIQNITNYLFEEGTTGNNEHYIKYYNFNLTAGHSAIVYLTGVLKQGFNFNQTVNCAFTSGAYDCEEFPLTPVPFVQKYQKIGNDNNPNSNGWTTHTLNVELGQYISYRIDFGNLGNKAATGEVKDILPQCVQYVNAYLIGANGNGPTYYPNTHTVRFKNIPLAAGQTAHMMVVGKIKQEDGCQNVYSYLNTGAFHFLGSSWGYSQVLAERPNLTDVEITKTVDKNKVKSGDTIIYTITYKNNGPEILQSYTIVDYWPNEQLEFAGVLEPSTPAPIWESENIVKRYFDTPLGVNEQRQIKIKGIVR